MAKMTLEQRVSALEMQMARVMRHLVDTGQLQENAEQTEPTPTLPTEPPVIRDASPDPGEPSGSIPLRSLSGFSLLDPTPSREMPGLPPSSPLDAQETNQPGGQS